MILTRLFLIRHAIVEPSARLTMYGDMDVPLCTVALAAEQVAHAWLAERLPRPARWFCTPLARTAPPRRPSSPEAIPSRG